MKEVKIVAIDMKDRCECCLSITHEWHDHSIHGELMVCEDCSDINYDLEECQ